MKYFCHQQKHHRSTLRSALLLGLTGGSMAMLAPPAFAETGDKPGSATMVVSEKAKDWANGQIASGSGIGLLGYKDVMDTPFNTVSYTQKFIRDHQVQDLGSVIGATDPSVYVPSKRSILETFFIRGFNVSADYSISFNGLMGMAPYMRGSTEMAERIDVLKGPSILLNGMPPDGNVGGSINIVPKRATDKPLAQVTATYESKGLGGIHIDLGKRFGDSNQFGIRFNGVYRDGRTAVDNQKHQMGLGSLGLDWRSERVRLSADIYKQREHMKGVNYLGISNIRPEVTQLPAPKKGHYSLAPDWSYTINNTTAVILKAEVSLTDSITAHAAWGYKDGGYDALVGGGTLKNNQGDLEFRMINSVRNGPQSSGEIGFNGNFETGPVYHSWSVVGNRFTSNLKFTDTLFGTPINTNYYQLNFGAHPANGLFAPQRITQELNSYAIADTLSFAADRIQWTLGARHQNVQSANYDKNDILTRKYDKNRISPATALLVKVTDSVSVYGNYIEGLSAGDTAPASAKNKGEIMQPYQSRQYEIGTKLDLGAFITTLSLFQIQKPSAYTDPVSNIFSDYGEQRNRGVEWSFFGETLPGLRVMGGVSYTRAELTKALKTTDIGKQVTGVPELLAKLGVEYDIAGLPGLTVTGNINYTDSRYVTNDNRFSLPSYTILNIGAHYTTHIGSQQVTVRADITNLTNKAYWIGSWSGRDGSGLSGGLGAPRTFLVSASVDF